MCLVNKGSILANLSNITLKEGRLGRVRDICHEKDIYSKVYVLGFYLWLRLGEHRIVILSKTGLGFYLGEGY